jgi:hypothetical protein
MMRKLRTPGAVWITASLAIFLLAGLWMWPRRAPLSALIERACPAGQMMILTAKWFPLLGYDDSQMVSRQELDDRTRILMILDGNYFAAGPCTDRQPPPADRFQIVIGHVTDASETAPEIHYYLTSAHGRLIKAVRNRPVEGWPVSVDVADHRVLADFEPEKKFWLARYGLR